MTIQAAPELYAHAIAIEREASERYAELASRMSDEGRDDLARVFAMLADLESEHLQALEARTLQAEIRAQAFFEGVFMTSDERLLETAPDPETASTTIFT